MGRSTFVGVEEQNHIHSANKASFHGGVSHSHCCGKQPTAALPSFQGLAVLSGDYSDQ